MYKTYYLKTWLCYNISGLITKAETLKEAKRKFKHYINRHYKDCKIDLNYIQELNKTEIIDFIS